jgi:GNAT superfamily N-acetyltransferase
MNEIIIRRAVPDEAQAIYELSCFIFGHDPLQPMNLHIPPILLKRHIERFDNGAIVARVDGVLVGYAIMMQTSYSPYNIPLNWHDAIGGVTMNKHDANGSWLYGVDCGVHPDFRKQGIGTQLYRVRFEVVAQRGLVGFYTGGMLAGYKFFSQHLTVEEYGEYVRQGRILDPTVTMQKNRGFELGAVIANYTGYSTDEDCAMLIVWICPQPQPTFEPHLDYQLAAS